jgi:curli biogenesis system outer membrane secretion channel CsgG
MDCVKTLIITFLLALSACTGVLAQQEQPQKKPVIGIKTFENPPNYANSTIGNGLTDLFITELAKTNKYQIVEREALKELIQEVELGQSAYGAKGSAVPKGRFRGMEYLFIAKVTNFGEKQKNIGGGGIGGKILGGVVGRRSEAYVRIDFRIVDATTGEIVYVGSGEGTDTTKGIALIGGVLGEGGGVFNASDKSFLESQVGRATIKALEDIIQKMDHDFLARITSGAMTVKAQETTAAQAAEEALKRSPGKILAVVNNQLIIVSLGAEHGLKIGDKLNVFKLETIKDSQGNVVYSEEKQIGVLTVTDVQADRSKAAVASGSGFAEGHIVRKQ